MIAIAWTDWDPGHSAPGSIKYATRGSAPNRKFVLQYTAVYELGINKGLDTGKVTAQLVLYEGSNDITIYTTSMWPDRSDHLVTQGIENADGTIAAFVPGRVRNFFRLQNDAVKFSLARPNEAPSITAPADISVSTTPPSVSGDFRVASAVHVGVGSCSAVVDPGVATAVDDADGVVVAGVRSDGLALDAAYPKGVTTIAWTATDAGGLTAQATQTITVADKENPVVTAPSNISTRTDRASTTANVTVGEATAADNCSDVNISAARSDNRPLSALFEIGLTTITWTATDGSGNTGSAEQTVTVVGNTPPVLTVSPSLSVNTDAGVCYAMAQVVPATATDDDAGTVVNGARSDGLALNAAYAKGTTTIMWTATDADGLTATGSQSVNVSDHENPSVMSVANVSVGNDHGLASASVLLSGPLASDNCPGVSVSASRSDGLPVNAPYPMGVTSITWTATDASGNSASSAQSVTVSDIDPPVISVPHDFSVDATSSSGAIASYAVSATDNVAVASAKCDPISGSQFPIGRTQVSCVASDAAGNSASGSFYVTVVGPEAQLTDLIHYILALGLPNGTTNPLVNQLRSAFGSTSDGTACTKMNDFIAMVSKKGSGIPDENAAYMLSEATRIATAMGCMDPTIQSTKGPRLHRSAAGSKH